MMGRLRNRAWTCLVAATCVLTTGQAWAFDEATADRALEFAREQLDRTSTSADIPLNQYPKNTEGNRTWKLVPADQRIDWIQGFYPGLLWFMYEAEEDPVWRERADARTRPIEVQKTNTQTHDLGFKFFPSFGHAYRLTGDASYRAVLLTAARSLAQRFHAPSGVIDCCDWNRRWRVPLVTDTMMNLELLFWAAENGGDPAWKDMALSHALVTLRDMVRPDGGTFHVVDYDDAGNIRSRETFQGHSDPSTWSRGHAWAIYGYTLAYRYTKDPRMLDAAIKVTNYYLDRLPPDSIPYWDMDAPPEQLVKDSSAAAAVASALLELHTFVTDAALKERYHAAALAMLDSLSSPAYLAIGTQSPGILLHGVAFYRTPIKPKGEAIDESLIYGDYYFVEALLRYKQSLVVPSPVPPPGSEPPAAPLPPGPAEDGQGGCASTAPGPTMVTAGLLLWLLGARRGRTWPRRQRSR